MRFYKIHNKNKSSKRQKLDLVKWEYVANWLDDNKIYWK